ncbi:unnamed protein product [Vitrella brassicaformis CCMP3155]|uniref:HECT-type E3 ubiquitin transferase n=3 Tax=Vitrella brassicaformis TaxID=1169539 RepID=A0A0G4H2Q6_VITBC|nr:unnamed protein product [Vitrella brassicaformis CCMP3155]|eukprot:CEM37948.1 unnamed protein product [Vitrella brassicaformis CCMP3155]
MSPGPGSENDNNATMSDGNAPVKQQDDAEMKDQDQEQQKGEGEGGVSGDQAGDSSRSSGAGGAGEGEKALTGMTAREKWQQRFQAEFQHQLLIHVNPTIAAAAALKALNDPRTVLAEEEGDGGPAGKPGAAHPESLPDKSGDVQKKRRESEKSSVCRVEEEVVEGEGGELTDQAIERAAAFLGDFYALNVSFFPTMSDGHDIDERSPEIDYGRVDQFYSRLQTASGGRALTTSIPHVERLCGELLNESSTKNVRNLLYARQLRFIPILLDHPSLEDYSYFDTLYALLRVVLKLQQAQQQVLVQWWSKMPLTRLQRTLQMVQQMLTIRTIEACDGHTDGHHGQPEQAERFVAVAGQLVKNAIKFIQLLYSANEARTKESLSHESSSTSVSVYRTPPNCLPMREFNNDAINATTMLIKHDFLQWIQGEELDLGLMDHPFLLDAASKATALKYDALIQQNFERRHAVIAGLMNNSRTVTPYLVFRVRRDSLVEDTLRALSSGGVEDLKKQLKVIFDGEEGVDEGGPAKEFFQLLVQELFNPDYGMFSYDSDTRFFWFNANALEANIQFELVGIVLGLAIYNGVILNIHFPLAVYYKLLLLNLSPRAHQLQMHNNPIKLLGEFMPNVAKGLEQLLEMSQPDDVTALGLVFSTYQERWGEMVEVPLKDNGGSVAVTIDNREEYVDLYVDWLLNKSIEDQFKAFHRGFHRVCGGRILELFAPEELERLICGSTDLDFQALEKSTRYGDGFTPDSATVKRFWEIAHQLSTDDKKQLLAFATGSDRVPIRGLASLNFVIQRNGPDSDKLPTAMTCFNVLLLPDYRTKEKLERFLKIAIQNAQGFGLQ